MVKMIQWMSNYDLIVVYESNDHGARQRSLADPGGPEIHILGTRVQLWVTLHRVVRHHLEQYYHSQTIQSAEETTSMILWIVTFYILQPAQQANMTPVQRGWTNKLTWTHREEIIPRVHCVQAAPLSPPLASTFNNHTSVDHTDAIVWCFFQSTPCA